MTAGKKLSGDPCCGKQLRHQVVQHPCLKQALLSKTALDELAICLHSTPDLIQGELNCIAMRMLSGPPLGNFTHPRSICAQEHCCIAVQMHQTTPAGPSDMLCIVCIGA
jgi:hypothetical protein